VATTLVIPYISKNNDIWVRQAMYIRKNPVGGAIKWLWKYNQGGGYADFVMRQSGAEIGSTWHCIDCPDTNRSRARPE
jgi:hypothetical protein